MLEVLKRLQPQAEVAARIEALITRNAAIHDHDCFNLNPATNVMNPKAEAALARCALALR